MKYFAGFIIVFILLVGILVFVSHNNTQHNVYPRKTIQTTHPTLSYAQGDAVIEVIPHSGTFSKSSTFSISIQITSSEVPFNAAQAKVTSSNLQVLSVTPGNCKFAFVGNPTPQKLSFTGAILGGKSSSCTAYTATVKGLKAGTATITFSDIQIVAQGLDKPIRTAVINGSYTIN